MICYLRRWKKFSRHGWSIGFSIPKPPHKNYPIDLEKLSNGFESFLLKDKENFMHAHLLNVSPPLVLKIHVPSPLFKSPFRMVFALVTMVLGLDNDFEIDEASLALLMLIFPLDDKSLVMFNFVEFIATHIKEQFITME